MPCWENVSNICSCSTCTSYIHEIQIANFVFTSLNSTQKATHRHPSNPACIFSIDPVPFLGPSWRYHRSLRCSRRISKHREIQTKHFLFSKDQRVTCAARRVTEVKSRGTCLRFSFFPREKFPGLLCISERL